jgi:hypothetical protein
MSTIPILNEKPEIPLPAQSDPPSLFRYSAWLHVGNGAEGCEEIDEAAGDNTCGDRSHFHAWCRMQNPLQQAEIRERALGAKARKIRQLRDAETDGYQILEEEFEARRREDNRGALIDELLQLDYWQDYYQAMLEARLLDDPSSDEEDAKLYARIEDDQARYLRLEAMGEDQRPADEYDELKRHLARYQEAIDEEMERRIAPRRATLEAMGTDDLIDQLRDKRIDNESQREFQRVFEIHQWLSCAYHHPGGPAVFADLAALEQAAPEVIEGLQATFMDLTKTAQEARGN